MLMGKLFSKCHTNLAAADNYDFHIPSKFAYITTKLSLRNAYKIKYSTKFQKKSMR